ncbi:response regulator transcription factor [Conexibacter arvalis]|uniref:DNA-binding NarL/FixJ family response regulator n=1 Tax=Conexibacter arvalis TaxID=912552 RepID=A0A840I701_9ACTN|nr:response regulator transcription factor [Conexibacter arvalis]MBB4660669.1 DNA-binding NarL/FixJ family response regulator [Conexibacter arvalis]
MSGTVTVLAVDDQEVFRRTARRLLAAAPGFEQVGEAASGPEALRLAAELRPDLVLLDVRMPGMDGIETARRLARSGVGATVVLISLGELPDPVSLRSVGAAGCLRKQDLSVRALDRAWAAATGGAATDAPRGRSAPP